MKMMTCPHSNLSLVRCFCEKSLAHHQTIIVSPSKTVYCLRLHNGPRIFFWRTDNTQRHAHTKEFSRHEKVTSRCNRFASENQKGASDERSNVRTFDNENEIEGHKDLIFDTPHSLSLTGTKNKPHDNTIMAC